MLAETRNVTGKLHPRCPLRCAEGPDTVGWAGGFPVVSLDSGPRCLPPGSQSAAISSIVCLVAAGRTHTRVCLLFAMRARLPCFPPSGGCGRRLEQGRHRGLLRCPVRMATALKGTHPPAACAMRWVRGLLGARMAAWLGLVIVARVLSCLDPVLPQANMPCTSVVLFRSRGSSPDKSILRYLRPASRPNLRL